MQKHKKLFILISILVGLALSQTGYYVISNWESFFKKSSTIKSANMQTYQNPTLGFSLIYPASWSTQEHGDMTEINPNPKVGSNIYFSIGKRKDFASLEDVKKMLAPNIVVTPTQVGGMTGFQYTDSDYHDSIWIMYNQSVYLIRVYDISNEAHDILASVRFNT